MGVRSVWIGPRYSPVPPSGYCLGFRALARGAALYVEVGWPAYGRSIGFFASKSATALAAAAIIGWVGGRMVIRTPIWASSRSTTWARSRTCAGVMPPALTEKIISRVCSPTPKYALPSTPLSAPFFRSRGSAPTLPSAHHWNWYGSEVASSCASATVVG